MSAHRDVSAFDSFSQNIQVSKGLAASRWAPTAMDDQMMVDQPMTDVDVPANKASKPTINNLADSRWAPNATDDRKMANQQMTSMKGPTDRTPKPTSNGLVNSRWAADAVKPYQTQNSNKTIEAQAQAQQKHLDPISNRSPFGASRGHNAAPVSNKPTTTTRRIIGALSEEEKTVKMENPFFNPEKHKGLSSSRWAD